ncbi:MAG: hypothetical protein P1V35_12865 [Planctomycetota bacterium]|nr:hypothetical protein [Planctomycetota bacterium]
MRSDPFAIRVFVTFLPMAFVGTMLHEAGHIVVAQALGYSTTLHYGSMAWYCDDWDAAGNVDLHSTLISMGGPLTNMGLGVIGLIWLARLAKQGRTEFEGSMMAACVLALFWSRQLFNAALVASAAVMGRVRASSDEVKIANDLGWPAGSILWATAALAALAILRTVAHIQRGQRISFALAGASGAVMGYLLWYESLGPMLLP